MDEGRFDRLTRQAGAAPSRRSVVGTGLGALAGILAVAGNAGSAGENKKKRKKKAPGDGQCLAAAKLCNSSDECCTATTGRVCGQNGCAHPDRPRCCAGVGQRCNGNSCECCGFDLDCVNHTCVYAPR